MVRAVFGDQLPSSQLTAAACVVTMSTCAHDPQRWFPRIRYLRCFLSYVLCRTSGKTAPRKVGVEKHVVCRVHVAGKPLKHVH